MRFLPSCWVTIGSNFGVLKVYTKPVSETTSNSTCVPVSTDSSNAFFMIPCFLLEKVTWRLVLFSINLISIFLLSFCWPLLVGVPSSISDILVGWYTIGCRDSESCRSKAFRFSLLMSLHYFFFSLFSRFFPITELKKTDKTAFRK